MVKIIGAFGIFVGLSLTYKKKAIFESNSNIYNVISAVILFVLFKRSIIILIFLFFLLTRAFKSVLRSCCSCLFREGQNSTYVSSVWLNVHDCTSLLVQRQHSFGEISSGNWP